MRKGYMRIPKRWRNNKNNCTGYCGFNEFGAKQTLGESMFGGREKEFLKINKEARQ